MNKTKQCKHGFMTYNAKDQYIGQALENYGEYSEFEVELFSKHIKNTDLVLDIGANIGAFVPPMSKMAKTVYAFEPQRWLYYMLCSNIAVNNLTNSCAFNMAVGSVTGSILVPDLDYSYDFNYGAISLCDKNWANTVPTTLVQKIAIDDMNLPDCNFIKIDVEGMEIDVLRGAKNTIAKYKPIIYVENDRQKNSADLINLLQEYNYSIEEHLPYLFNPDNYFNNSNNIYPTVASKNLLCISK